MDWGRTRTWLIAAVVVAFIGVGLIVVYFPLIVIAIFAVAFAARIHMTNVVGRAFTGALVVTGILLVLIGLLMLIVMSASGTGVTTIPPPGLVIMGIGLVGGLVGWGLSFTPLAEAVPTRP